MTDFLNTAAKTASDLNSAILNGLDMTIAFDRMRHRKLFMEVKSHDITTLVGLVLFLFVLQECEWI